MKTQKATGFNKRWQRLIAALLVFALVAAFAAACNNAQPVEDAGLTPAPTPAPTESDADGGDPYALGVPLLWRATSPAGQSIYLFGSIHVGNEEMYPLPDFIMDAFHRSDFLAVEINPNLLDDEIAMTLALMSMYLDGRTIADDIGDELFEIGMELFERLNAPNIEIMPLMKPFFWWNTLSYLAAEEAGLSGDLGIDMHFIELAEEIGMEILEVESAMEQFEMLAGFSMPLQVALLASSILYFDESAAGVTNLLEMWRQGDVQGILQLTAEEETGLYGEYLELMEELMEEYWTAMMTERDIRMTQVARNYMAQGKNVFFMVGLLHFIVEDGIIDLLRQEGYEVVRIR